MASDVEKNPRGTRVFKTRVPSFSFLAICSCGTRVPPFSFRSDCSSSSSSSSSSSLVLSHLLLHFFIPDHFICFSDCSASSDLCFDSPNSSFGSGFRSGSSSSSSADSFIELEFEKLKFYVDILLQLSTRTRVFET